MNDDHVSRTEVSITHEHEHLFARVDGHRLLIDTGAPTSMGDCVVPWRGQTVDFGGRAALIDLADLSRLAGVQIDGLIGADLLLDQDMMLNIQDGWMRWPQEPVPVAENAMAMRQMMGVPICEVSVAGTPAPYAIDTGASRTFINGTLATGADRLGTIEDFYPGLGAFTAETVAMRWQRGDVAGDLEAAILPAQLGGLMQMFGIEGIIGLDVLAAGPMHFAVSEGAFHPAVSLDAASG